jgi:hypothetical protein
MSKLSPKHQFRLERKYRRRAALKYARPKFIKAVTIGQWVIIGCESLPDMGWLRIEFPVIHKSGIVYR